MINRKLILNIIEGAVIAGILLFVIVMSGSGSSKKVPMDEIQNRMISMDGVSDLISKDAAAAKASIGMVPSEFLYYKTEEIMDVRELFIAYTEDENEMSQIEAGVQSHLAKQIDNFTGYGTNQIDLLKHAVSMRKGNYYFFAVGEENEKWQQAFLKLVS